MKKFLNFIKKKERGMGLVEALIALAVVATGMVVITSLSLKTIKYVRRNEMQDVAVQIGVEAMDFMKQPGKIETNDLTNIAGYYKLDISSVQHARIIKDTSPAAGEIYNCDGLFYKVGYITDMNVCQQIQIQTTTFSDQYNVKVIIVWVSIGSSADKYEKRIFTVFRRGSFK